MNNLVAAAPTAIDNSEAKLSVQVGLIAGLIGSLSIIVVVTGILLVSGNNIWTAARLIATSVYGPQAGSGVAPVLVGTLLHLVTGSVFGAIFARILPRLPRNIFVLAGLMYGILTWIATGFLVLPVVAPLLVATDINIGVLLIAHVIYGFILGIAGASYGLWWNLPASLRTLQD